MRDREVLGVGDQESRPHVGDNGVTDLRVGAVEFAGTQGLAQRVLISDAEPAGELAAALDDAGVEVLVA